MIIVLFGKPGAGKNYIGNILSGCDFFFCDGDNSLTATMKRGIKRGVVISEEMRAEFYRKIIEKIKNLNKQHAKIVLAQSFSKNKYRKIFLEIFPEAQFILIEAGQKIRKERILKRKGLADYSYLKQIDKLFEAPKIKHAVLRNNKDGHHIKTQLKRLGFFGSRQIA